MFGRQGLKSNPFAQIVMPVIGFANMVALFVHAKDRLITAGFLKQEDYDQMVASVDEINRPPQGAGHSAQCLKARAYIGFRLQVA